MSEIKIDQQGKRRVDVQRFEQDPVVRIFFLDGDQTCGKAELTPQEQNKEGVEAHWPRGWPNQNGEFWSILLRIIRGG